MNPLRELTQYGQAVWLDDLHRDLVAGGELKRLIEEDGLSGLTSNPAIFQKAISDGSAYGEDIRQLKDKRLAAEEIFNAIAVHDVQMAADAFRPLYDRTGGEQGYVSLEVSPHFAHHTKPTIEEARRLWWAVARPNIFIKVPATREGLSAIEQLLSEGINVNVTLLFGLRRYGEVANAFIAGVEKRRRSGESIENLRSVASFFLSRIDVMVNPELEELIRLGGDRGKLAEPLRGEVAIACAKAAYQMHKQIFAGDRWSRLAEKGGHPQRLLWASTGTKNPDDSEVKYVEPLIGPDTVNTMPMKTLKAYRDQGRPQARLEEDMEHARRVLSQLPRLDIDLEKVSGRLEDEGIAKFQKPFDQLLKTLEEELQAA